jgi:pyruvate/2-oxoglutarate dehydrogenase complex dihydrolipoamide dehydrogenase (E3) component
MQEMFDNFMFVQSLTTPGGHTTTGISQTEDGIFLKWIEDTDPDQVYSMRIAESDATDILDSLRLALQMISKAMKLGEVVC